MDLVPYAIPFFVLSMLAEWLYGLRKGRNTYRVNDTVGSLFMGTLRTASKLVLIGVGGAVFAATEDHFALWRMDTGNWATWVFAFIAYDFCYYWNHRIGHERQIFWASHVAHHQSEEYNLSTALRQTSTGFLLSWLFYVPLFLLGVPAEVYVTVASANLIYQFWVHTEHIPKLGWFEWFFVSPSNHRVHHAQNARYMDRNYGGVFIVWDRLFGTYQEEQDDEPCVFGIRGPLHTFNPLWANLHIYVGMAQDAWRTADWRDRLRVIVSRTGWRPSDVAAQYPREKTDLAQFVKYDPQVSVAINAYALLQLLVTTAVGTLLLFLPALNWAETAASIGLMLMAMVCTGIWLDGRRPLGLETLRLGLLGLMLLAGWPGAISGSMHWLLWTYLLSNVAALPLLAQAQLRLPNLAAQ
ncbi:MAG: sterol desaturase family protein [Pseudomonadota bacterium]